MQRILILGALGCLLLVSTLAGQKSKRQSPERIAKLVNACVEGSAVVRPQAAERLLKMGEPAVAPVLERLKSAGPDPTAKAWFDLGSDFLRVAAQVAPVDGEERALFWKAVFEPSFPWRAALVAGLARNHQPGEWPRFERLADDPLSAVRLASLEVEPGLSDAQALEFMTALYKGEPDDRVRRLIAKRMVQRGSKQWIWPLVDELQRTDKFFDQPSGMVARLEAAKYLQDCLPGSPLVDGSLDPQSEDGEAQRAALRAWIVERYMLDPQEVAAKPFAGQGHPLVGLELRSCRRGEFFVRWTDAGEIWVGRGVPAVLRMPAGSLESLIALLEPTTSQMGKQYLTGKAGCDLEGVYLSAEEGTRAKRYLVTKGPDPVPGLRPEPLNALVRGLIQTVPDGHHADPRVHELRKRLAEALREVGGAWDGDAEEVDSTEPVLNGPGSKEPGSKEPVKHPR